MEEIPKKENSPTTEQWHKTVLEIKAFCEKHDIELSGAQYGWFATFFYELLSNKSLLRE